MPTFTFTGPDGKDHDIEGPEGSTPEQAFQSFQTHLSGGSGQTADDAKKIIPPYANVHVPGMTEQGNLELWNRPAYLHPDFDKSGGYGTTASFSREENGKEVLVPRIVNGKLLSPAEAWANYQKTGQHLGKFETTEQADQYANSLHDAQAAYVEANGGAKAFVNPEPKVGQFPNATAQQPASFPHKPAAEPSTYDYLAAGPGGAFTQGATEGGQEAMRLPIHIAANIADIGGIAPNPTSKILRSGAEAMDAWVNNQRQTYEAARQKFENPASRLWETAGAAVPALAAGAAIAAPEAATTVLGNLGRGLVQGGKSGAVTGLLQPADASPGNNYLGNKAVQVGEGVLTGAGMGAAIGAGSAKAPAAQTTADFKTQSDNLYKQAKDSGTMISKSSFKPFAKDLENTIAEEGISKRLHGSALGALQDIQDAADNHVTLKGIDLLRQNVGDVAATAGTPGERRLAGIMRDKIDQYMGSIEHGDLISGSPEAASEILPQARALWSQYKKSSVIDDLLERAKNRTSTFTASGFENALRTQFRNLADNKVKMRSFAPEEQDAIKLIVRGGAMDNAFRFLGRFAVRGPVSAGFARLFGGPAAEFALMSGAELGRFGAQQGTLNNIDNLRNIVQRAGTNAPKNIGGQTAATRLLSTPGAAAMAAGPFNPWGR